MTRPYYYKLNPDHSISPCSIIDMGQGPIIVKQENVGNYFISTVFLCIDYNFIGGGAPLFFETMIFPQPGYTPMQWEEYQERCSTYEEAIEMHEKAKEWVLSR